MEFHIENECAMQPLECAECKQQILRKHQAGHTRDECAEHAIPCEYKEFGCQDMVKRKLMRQHIVDSELQHLRLKVDNIPGWLL